MKFRKYINESEKLYKGYAIFAKTGKEGKIDRMAKKSDLKKGTLLRGMQGVDGGYLVRVTGNKIKNTHTGDIEFEFFKFDNNKIYTSILSNFGIPVKVRVNK